MVLAESESSLCKHHTNTVFEAMHRNSFTDTLVKDTRLVYPDVSHMNCIQSLF